MQTENKYLQIEGRVSKKVLNKLFGEKITDYAVDWFFVDYAPATFKKGIIFDIVLVGNEGDEITIAPFIYHIGLMDIMDQFSNHLEEIPEGWKTICRFDFQPNASVAGTLPELDEWKYNIDSLKIARHQDLKIETNSISKNAYAGVFEELFFYAMHSHSINRKNFMTDILKLYEENKEEINEKMPPALFRDVEKQLHNLA